MKTYQECGIDVKDTIADVLKTHHRDLHDMGLTIDAVFVSKEKKDGEDVVALKRHGVAAAATIQITPLSDRARGMADAKLTIDMYAWTRLADHHRVALIDHELEHLCLNVGKKSGPLDDLSRPKLKIRPHDWELAGFTSIAERHGESALEVQEIFRFRADQEQLMLFVQDETTRAETRTATA